MVNRFSSRTYELSESFLNDRLRNAKSYDRIAGYFSSSMLEVAGEAIESITGGVRIICNSDLDALDTETARAADMALKKEWSSKIDEKVPYAGQKRFQRLYELLKSGKLEVRVLPNDYFGLIHGKAGIITLKSGYKTAFMGSVNETLSAWKLNYEMVWEDDSDEAIKWVQEEFNALWNHPKIAKLSNFIIEDIGRIAERKVINIEDWKQQENPASVVIESPIYRKEYGLWAHQKYFVNKAYEDHINKIGARYILADQVGLGKTVQLALSAQLMALQGGGPILIIVPKSLVWQWQLEMKTLLDMPSAVWDGKQWITEDGIIHNSTGPESIISCPRLVGIISQGIISRRSESAKYLLEKEYECLIVDECHRARRKNLKKDGENDPPENNNLLAFIRQLAKRSKSVLLATATPVQLYPIEAYDLLDVLSQGNEHVIGNLNSFWRKNKKVTIDLSSGTTDFNGSIDEVWNYLRNPMPHSKENEQLFGKIRQHLGVIDQIAVVEGRRFDELRSVDKNRISTSAKDFFPQYNPFIRHIVRRTRSFLENEIDPSTNETYLKKVEVELFGDKPSESILLPGYLKDAYETAEAFCKELSHRMKSAGFLKTMILKRLGSSIEAGKATATKMIGSWLDEFTDEVGTEDDIDPDESGLNITANFKQQSSKIAESLTSTERELLYRLIKQLSLHQDNDPKYNKLKSLLIDDSWLSLGCIVFSQYFDTAWYMASTFSRDNPSIDVGLYAGGTKSGIVRNGELIPFSKEEIKRLVQAGQLKLLFGTDAASEGLNLQRLSTLINIDLPWNPTRLEQRKGRIQRIGQIRDSIKIFNMRYKDSVEDRVHAMLADRLEQINQMFGQIPDVLEAVWIEVAIGDKIAASEIIDALPKHHPFEMKYNKVENINWEQCSSVLDSVARKEILFKKW